MAQVAVSHFVFRVVILEGLHIQFSSKIIPAARCSTGPGKNSGGKFRLGERKSCPGVEKVQVAIAGAMVLKR